MKRIVAAAGFALGLMLSVSSIVLLAPLVQAPHTIAKDSSDSPGPPRMRFLNAATGLSKLDIAIDGEQAARGLAFGKTSNWTEVAAGTRHVTAQQAGEQAFDWSLFDNLYPIADGQSYEIVITDYFMIPTLVDQSPLPKNTARLRITHGSPQSPAIDLSVKDSTKPLIGGLAYTGSSDYMEVPAGVYDLVLNAAGKDDNLLDLKDMKFQAGKIYDVVVIGQDGSKEHPLAAVILISDAGKGAPAKPSNGEATPAP